MKKEEINIFDKGRKVAEEISSVMFEEDNVSTEHLDEWLVENGFSEDVVNTFIDGDKFKNAYSRFKTDKSVAINRMAKELNRKRRNGMLFRIVASSAAAVAIVSFLLFNDINSDSVQPVANIAVAPVTEKETDMNKPLLITGDGEEIDLTKTVTLHGGHAIVEGDGLKYEKVGGGDSVVQKALNKLVMPNKCTYSVTLSDGTKVYLNSNTTLEYPTMFSGETREVILTGEAYFEVEKNTGKPFIVRSGTTSVKVYGTKFNVNAYDTKSVKTSLVSGSVGMSVEGKREIKIKPGQMVSMNTKSGVGVVSYINTNKYEAWLNGYFRCDDEDIEIILSDIERWYGVTFGYSSAEVSDSKISASINRDMPIEDVLKLLELSSEVKFAKKGGSHYIVK